MTTVGTFSMLGIGTFLISEMHRRVADRPRLFVTGLTVATVSGMVVGALFALLAPYLIPTLAPLRESAGTVLTFALGAGITTFMLVLEALLIGIGRYQRCWRNL